MKVTHSLFLLFFIAFGSFFYLQKTDFEDSPGKQTTTPAPRFSLDKKTIGST